MGTYFNNTSTYLFCWTSLTLLVCYLHLSSLAAHIFQVHPWDLVREVRQLRDHLVRVLRLRASCLQQVSPAGLPACLCEDTAWTNGHLYNIYRTPTSDPSVELEDPCLHSQQTGPGRKIIYNAILRSAVDKK